MVDIHETRLPGVGKRLDFTAKSGERIGVIVHRSGRRDVILCSRADPDVCHDLLSLDEEDARALVEALAVAHVTEETARLQLALGGLAIDWVEVLEGAPGVGHNLHDLEHVEQAEASIVAVVRDGRTMPSPPSTFVPVPGDTVIIVGAREGVDSLTGLLTGG